MTCSLRCSNAFLPSLADVIAAKHHLGRGPPPQGLVNSSFTEPVVGPDAPTRHPFESLLKTPYSRRCARDLVAECRRCGWVVCRNCAAKAPSDRWLPDRFRRLCTTCVEAPLSDHVKPFEGWEDHSLSDVPGSASSASSVRSIHSQDSDIPVDIVHDEDFKPILAESFTSSAFMRRPCVCATKGVYLCKGCGLHLRASDITYKRVWTWRSRYSTHIGGGLGTGLGQGDQGQKCGRGRQCLEHTSKGVCWVEIDCQDAQADQGPVPGEQHGVHDLLLETEPRSTNSPGPSVQDSESNDRPRDTPGYFQQEIEGIGGVVKKKVKKRVKVGATVSEFDDEREKGKYLVREASGQVRAWCGWCERIVPARGEDEGWQEASA